MSSIWEKIKEFRLYVFLFLGLAVIGGFLIFRNQQKELNYETDFSQLIEKESSTIESSSSPIYIDVKGAVHIPGLYQIAPESRLIEAIELAGGFTAEADQSQLNFALKLADQQVIYVPKVGEEPLNTFQSPDNSGGPSGEADKVNINTADLAELQTLSGIGEKKAQDIINYRQANGSFANIEDLTKVSGIGEKTLEKLKDFITV
ncbi:helix-hairpin-helix domain-containing protein [Enterococcus sp. HY326]|uniref:helix-hairpin-helix domain-containing protein n=1 Tax=Enterococcus sp. HY326 TaxID=2971265 RepID=UPI00223EB170|nr:helix-hairpin-helix domain-containing protein [Enterococcus sp. HY326]